MTRIGTGLAGWADAVVAPLFTEAPDNCLFDEAWKPILGDNKRYWGTYGQMVPTGVVAAGVPATPADPLSLTDGHTV